MDQATDALFLDATCSLSVFSLCLCLPASVGRSVYVCGREKDNGKNHDTTVVHCFATPLCRLPALAAAGSVSYASPTESRFAAALSLLPLTVGVLVAFRLND